jgi:glycosyltransferase involved in cell wall biosynthesis
MIFNILYIRPLKETLEALVCDSIRMTYINDLPLTDIKEANYIRARLVDNIIISSFSLLKTLLFKIRKYKIDLILVNAIKDLPYVVIFTKIFFNRYRPLIFVFSHNPFTFKNNITNRISLYMIKKYADGFIALTYAQASHVKLNGIDNVCIIPNTVSNSILNGEEQEEAFYENSSARKIIKIVYVAHIEKRKAQLVAIEAFRVLKEEYKVSNICLKLIGAVLDKKYKKLLDKYIKKYDLTKNVVFTKRINHDAVLRLVKESDIVVFTSTLEVLPRAIIEAMALGRPVIASEIDGVIDLIKNYETGILVRKNDPFQLAEEIYKLITDEGLRRKISIEGYKFIKEYCSHDRIRSLLSAFYIEMRKKKEDSQGNN